jgi:hypothetical protein
MTPSKSSLPWRTWLLVMLISAPNSDSRVVGETVWKGVDDR